MVGVGVAHVIGIIRTPHTTAGGHQLNYLSKPRVPASSVIPPPPTAAQPLLSNMKRQQLCSTVHTLARLTARDFDNSVIPVQRQVQQAALSRGREPNSSSIKESIRTLHKEGQAYMYLK